MSSSTTCSQSGAAISASDETTSRALLTQVYHCRCSRVASSSSSRSSRSYFPTVVSNEFGRREAEGLETPPGDVRLFLNAPVIQVHERLLLLAKRAFGMTGSQSWWRAYPSSGGLHPLESYWLVSLDHVVVVAAGGGSLGPLVLLHFDPLRDTFSLVATVDKKPRGDSASSVSMAICLVTLSPWRTVFKYKRRGFRYYALDAGHMLSSIHVAAATLTPPLSLYAVGDGEDEMRNRVLQWSKTLFRSCFAKWCDAAPELRWEMEYCVEAILVDGVALPSRSLLPADVCIAAGGDNTLQLRVVATPVLLSRSHFNYSIQLEMDQLFLGVDERLTHSHLVSVGCDVLRETLLQRCADLKTSEGNSVKSSVEEVLTAAVLHRRSARELCPRAIASHQAFLRIANTIAAVAFAQMCRCVFFVHRVEGLPSGVYVTVPSSKTSGRSSAPMREFLSDLSMRHDGKVDAEAAIELSAGGIHLVCLRRGSCTEDAYTFVGEQDLGRDGCFLVTVWSHLTQSPLNYFGQHIAAGVTGHAVYMASELEGMRANGMGYFDEEALNTTMLSSAGHNNSSDVVEGDDDGVDRWQCLYTIAVGISTQDVEMRFVNGGKRKKR